jgi:hypothetical protein
MNREERSIYTGLKSNPDMIYVTADGTKLYTLVTGGMMCFSGVDFSSMDEEQINLYIQEKLTKKFG